MRPPAAAAGVYELTARDVRRALAQGADDRGGHLARYTAQLLARLARDTAAFAGELQRVASEIERG